VGNTLYYGDNLDILRRYISDESVDLIYLDPPFNSSVDYNVLFAEHSGDRAAAQIKAFEDTWTWSIDSVAAFEEVVECGGTVSQALQAFRQMLGDSDMMAYLAMMAPRLLELHRVLKPTGTMYLHCDPTASHYLKVLLDSIFGPRSFRNEIIWKRTSAHNRLIRYGPVHDTILMFTKSDTWTWNPQHVPYTQEYTDDFYRHIEPGTGRRYRLSDVTSNNPGGSYLWRGDPPPGKRFWGYSEDTMKQFEAAGRLVYSKNGIPSYKRYLDEMPGQLLQDVWTDIDPISAQSAERLGYPTQKPEALLRRLLNASADTGDVVLDPFCGCGTTISVAQQLGLRWIGIDITHLAVGLIRHRLLDQFGSAITATYNVVGEPVSIPDAESLASEDQFQFQAWALGLVGARTAYSAKRGADKGIDGNLYFHDEPKAKTKRIVLSVKAGQNLGVAMVRDLVGTVAREKADIGVLITMAEPTGPMVKEAASAGFYASPMGGKHAKIQILTIAKLLAGKGIDYPARSQRADVTFRKARRIISEAQALPFSALVPPVEDEDD
jgi:DNA modification methylase